MKRKGFVLLAAVFILAASFYLVGSRLSEQAPESSREIQLAPEIVSYSGVDGKNALELLKAQAEIEQDASGLVVSINGVKAEASQREFWAFYVNDKSAQVGPLEYQTKNSDHIEWRLETY